MFAKDDPEISHTFLSDSAFPALNIKQISFDAKSIFNAQKSKLFNKANIKYLGCVNKI
jgi:hypothetical protein